MIRVAIIGAGALGKHIVHYLLQTSDLSIVGYYDDYQKAGTTIEQFPVLGRLDEIISDYEKNAFDKLLIGIGYKHMHIRQQLYDHFSQLIPFATYIHPFSYIDSSVSLGNGVVVLPGCIFDKGVKVGNNVFFNIGCKLAHDTTINANCFFGPGVKSAGFVTIGMHCFIGIDTTIINNIHICDDVQTGGGTVITSDINEPGLYAGTPAKFLKPIKV